MWKNILLILDHHCFFIHDRPQPEPTKDDEDEFWKKLIKQSLSLCNEENFVPVKVYSDTSAFL